MGSPLLTTLVKLAAIISVAAAQCRPRDYGWGSQVCVCNTEYCDFIGDVGPPQRGAVAAFESTKRGLRFAKTVMLREALGSNDSNALQLVIDPSKTYQTILGFGGAFTDAVGINLRTLPLGMQDDILRSYYSKQGIEYSTGRIPIASTDFSTHKYTYDDIPGDVNLTNFKLAPEDFHLKIPYIRRAMYLSRRPIWFFASSWSSPAWLKTNNALDGLGFLRGSPGGPIYKIWANYYVRFLQEYERQGIPIRGLTAQNEPTAGYVPFYRWQALGFSAQTQRDFVKLDLGPALAKAGYGMDRVKVMIIDDNRIILRKWANVILGDPEAAKYVSGVAVHWYLNRLVGPSVLDIVHQSFPGKFILPTEACAGYGLTTINKVKLGSWERAEYYASDILGNLNHWATGWTDWNLVLNTLGGPNWARNFVDSPIIVNATAQEFYKQPMYYAIGHFSKFIPPGSVRIDSRLMRAGLIDLTTKLEFAAFLTPEQAIVVIVLNKSNSRYPLNIRDTRGSANAQKTINERSITTFIWQPFGVKPQRPISLEGVKATPYGPANGGVPL